MSGIISYIAVGVCIAVVAVLFLGIGSFARGGEFNARNSNLFMRWRVGLQAVAIALLLFGAWIAKG